MFDDVLYRIGIKSIFGNRRNWERFCYEAEWLESQILLGSVVVSDA